MRSKLLFASVFSALAFGAQTAQAQAPARSSAISVNRGLFAVSPYGGYLVSQTFFEGPLNTKLTVQSSPLYGLQASLPLAPSASLVGSFAYGSGDLNAGVPIIGGISIGTSTTALFDASVELRAENFGGGRFIPVVELGGGAVRRTVTVAGAKAKTTDFQVSGALGADFPVAKNLALRLMAKDYWGKADFGSIGPLNAKTDDLHAIALTGGVRFAF